METSGVGTYKTKPRILSLNLQAHCHKIQDQIPRNLFLPWQDSHNFFLHLWDSVGDEIQYLEQEANASFGSYNGYNDDGSMTTNEFNRQLYMDQYD